MVSIEIAHSIHRYDIPSAYLSKYDLHEDIKPLIFIFHPDINYDCKHDNLSNTNY